MSDARGFGYGLLAGLGMMFLLDPRQGNARRALVRDKSRRTVREVEDALHIGSRDLGHRVEGMIARMFGGAAEEPISDDVLVARVRARLGHVCNHAHGIQVNAKGNGCIELKGPVLAEEHERIVWTASHVPGVRELDDDLVVHTEAGDVPGLQGEAHLGPPLNALWTPSTRLALGIASLGIALSSLLRGNAFGVLFGGAGVLGIARTITRRQSPRRIDVKQIVGEKLGVQPLREAYEGRGSEWTPSTSETPERERETQPDVNR